MVSIHSTKGGTLNHLNTYPIIKKLIKKHDLRWLSYSAQRQDRIETTEPLTQKTNPAPSDTYLRGRQ